MFKYARTFLFFAVIFFTCVQSIGQKTSEKFKPPVVNSFIGKNSNGAIISAHDADEIITLPIVIKDKNNNIYKIDSYGFLYKRKGVVIDEETGKQNINFTSVSERFTTTPLPKLWLDNIKDNFQKDEELYFFDIVVKDKDNHIFLAPDLKISIQ